MLVLTAIGCGVQSFCRKNGSDDELNVSNSLFRDDRFSSHRIYKMKMSSAQTAALHHGLLIQLGDFSLGGSGDDPPCMNCLLIEMGEMVCYTPRDIVNNRINH